jgi:ketosteroid isomerase-like protein
MKQTATNVAQRLHEAIDQRDAEALLSLYADTAEMRIVDRMHPPSKPLEMHGKRQISEYFHDIFSRDMTHRIEDEVIGDDRLAFMEACQYPDGLRVVTSSILQLQDGKIVHEVDVQEWDE